MSVQNCQPITEHRFEFAYPENEACQNGGAEQSNKTPLGYWLRLIITNLHLKLNSDAGTRLFKGVWRHVPQENFQNQDAQIGWKWISHNKISWLFWLFLLASKFPNISRFSRSLDTLFNDTWTTVRRSSLNLESFPRLLACWKSPGGSVQ